MTQEAMKLALEYIQAVPDDRYNAEHIDRDALITAIKEALAQPEQEPVGMVKDLFTNAAWDKLDVPGSTKVYLSTPPQRTEPVIDKSAAKRIATTLGWTPPRPWVGLTDEEISEVLGSDIHDEPSGELRFIRAIEAKLKEKNT